MSEWASNVVLVKKKDGAWRMCIDYRDLNLKTLNPDSYMLPRIDDTLDALSRAKYFCTLDILQGYHNVELTEEAKPKTAFHAPYCNPSHWEYDCVHAVWIDQSTTHISTTHGQGTARPGTQNCTGVP